ncbi:MAG: DUF5700 domain-containing putative Zn-dependent protease [Candidatus Zixiibacteriota bacterium]
MKRTWVRYALIFLIVAAAGSCGTSRKPAVLLDTGAVVQLLDVLDTIAAHTPAVEQTTERLGMLDPAGRRRLLDSLADQNGHDPAIGKAIDALVGSPGYQFYYSHFKNVTPAIHRDVLCHLPFEAADAPGNIGGVLHELYSHRKEVRQWMTTVAAGIDPERARRIASDWLPPGEYTLPGTVFFYDGNGDAFAARNGVGFDLFGVMLGQLPESQRFSELASMGSDWIEKTLAHEYHHIFSGDQIYSAPRENSPASAGVARITRHIVSEGLATQCDPRSSLDREIITDTSVIGFWIANLKQHAALFAADPQGSAVASRWLDSCSGILATEQRDLFLRRRFGDAGADSAAARAIIRPDMIHTLGRWMVQHISHDGQDKSMALGLLHHPDSIYVWYDRSMAAAPQELKFGW